MTAFQVISASKVLLLFYLTYEKLESLPDHMCYAMSNHRRAQKVSYYYWRPGYRHGGSGGYNQPQLTDKFQK